MAVYYCTATDLTDGLPDDWASYLSAGDLTTARARGKNRVDSRLPDYWPFPDVTATPSTPDLIRHAATLYGQAECTRTLKLVHNYETDLSVAAQLAIDADAILIPIAEKRAVVPRETKSAEALSFGSIAAYPGEHVLAASPYTVIPTSARIANYRYGDDFDVIWRQDVRSWMLRRLNAAIVGGVGGSTVTYDYTYLRRVEIESPGPTSVVVTRVS